MALDQDFDGADEPKEMTFFEHIDEMRKYILRALAGVGIFTVLALVFPNILFDKIIFGPTHLDFWTYQRMCELSYMINNTDNLCIKSIDYVIFSPSVTAQFTQYFMVSIIAGIVLAFPWILFQFWQFIKPALNNKEVKYAKQLVGFGSLLFFAGILFGFFMLTPISLNFLGSFKLMENIENRFTVDSYISFVTMLTLATGIIFELPIIIYFLAKLGLVTAAFLRKYRRYALIIVLVLAAIITPPDVTSQILMSIPLAILYEIGIVIAKRVEKRNAANAT
jgi:sec-independent protein translocase protein TatC